MIQRTTVPDSAGCEDRSFALTLTRNDFLDTPVILEDGEEYPAYTRYLSTQI